MHEDLTTKGNPPLVENTKTIAASAPADKDNKDKQALSDLEAFIKAGAHFGHKKTNWNPKMKSYIHSLRGGIHIIDLEKTLELLDKAIIFLNDVIKQGRKIIFVGLTPSSENIAKETAKELNMPYVVGRWLGGTLTNFSIISKRIEYFKEREAMEAAGEFKKYTKKERLNFKKELDDLKEKFGGVRDLNTLPGAVFVFNAYKDKLPIQEAKRKGIPVVGIADTNANPDLIDYLIPANDDSIQALKLISGRIVRVLKNRL